MDRLMLEWFALKPNWLDAPGMTPNAEKAAALPFSLTALAAQHISKGLAQQLDDPDFWLAALACGNGASVLACILGATLPDKANPEPTFRGFGWDTRPFDARMHEAKASLITLLAADPAFRECLDHCCRAGRMRADKVIVQLALEGAGSPGASPADHLFAAWYEKHRPYPLWLEGKSHPEPLPGVLDGCIIDFAGRLLYWCNTPDGGQIACYDSKSDVSLSAIVPAAIAGITPIARDQAFVKDTHGKIRLLVLAVDSLMLSDNDEHIDKATLQFLPSGADTWWLNSPACAINPWQAFVDYRNYQDLSPLTQPMRYNGQSITVGVGAGTIDTLPEPRYRCGEHMVECEGTFWASRKPVMAAFRASDGRMVAITGEGAEYRPRLLEWRQNNPVAPKKKK